MKLNLGGYATTEVDGFKSIERTDDGKIYAVFDSSAANGGTVSFVVYDDGSSWLGNTRTILIEAQHSSVKE